MGGSRNCLPLIWVIMLAPGPAWHHGVAPALCLRLQTHLFPLYVTAYPLPLPYPSLPLKGSTKGGGVLAPDRGFRGWLFSDINLHVIMFYFAFAALC